MSEASALEAQRRNEPINVDSWALCQTHSIRIFVKGTPASAREHRGDPVTCQTCQSLRTMGLKIRAFSFGGALSPTWEVSLKLLKTY